MHHDEYGERIFTRRAFFIGFLQVLGLGVLGVRLAWLQVAQGKRYKMLSDKNRINIRMLAPLRGEVVDRYGVPLAVNTKTYRALIIPEQTEDIKASLKALQNIIDVSEKQIDKVLKDASKTAKFIPIKIRDDLSWDDVAKVEVRLPDLPGISIDVGDVRSYPYRNATAHIVGYVQSVSKKDMENDDPVLKLPGFKVGKTGIEKVYDRSLRGKAGASEVEVNVVGREVRELRRKNAVYGSRVTLSIDGELQRFTLDALSKHKSASAVIMDAHTGAIYAIASYPAFDPNIFVDGISQNQWNEIMEDVALPLNNKATSGQYPPGSTFKMVTALAGLKAGVINKNTKVHCPGYYTYGTDKFHCWKKYGHGSMNLETSLAQSCDTYFYKMATEVGIEAIADMARLLGLGQKLGSDLQGQLAGLMPTKAWKKSKLGRAWRGGDTINACIGQGDVLATPLQLAVMTARIVNGGYAVEPWITGYLGDQFLGSKRWGNLGLSEDHIRMVMRGMDKVVNHEKGTAFQSRIEDVTMAMAGKTGTAQVQRITAEQRRLGIKNEDLPWKQRHHALFVGYAPKDTPKYVCSVVVEHGVGGSKAAAPLAKILLEQVQARDPVSTQIRKDVSL